MENTNQAIPTQNTQPAQLPEKYFDFIKNSLKRIWKHKFLWFWGIFLPAGTAFNFNFNNPFGDQNSSEFQEFQNFASTYWQWLIAGAIILFLISIAFWIISAIARRGVVKSLNRLQTEENPKDLGFKKVWQLGKQKFTSLLGLDLIIFFSIFIFLAIIGLPIILTAIAKNFVLMAILIGVAILIFIPVIFIVVFTQNISVILISLLDEGVFKAIKKSLLLIKHNIKESLKLVFVFIVMGIFISIIFMVFAFILLILFIIIGIILKLIGMNDQTILISLIPIGLLIFFAASIFTKLFTSLWKTDIWLWWVKKINGLKIIEGKLEIEKIPANALPESQPTVLQKENSN
jgi:hypothetical protein